MPTDRADAKPDAGERPAALFLFAHQDDEFGVFHAIEDCVRRGLRVRCAYLTHGADGVAARRNAESLRVLARLGVDRRDVRFAGDQLDICDASLPRHLDAAGDWLAQWVAASGAVERLYVTAWEGGHHDHDALHLLALRTAADLGIGARVRQYSLYHGDGLPGPWFRVLAPLAANGAVERSPIAWRARWRYLSMCLSYPSQRVTWIGLFPFVLLHYLWRGRQEVQPAALARLAQRPHPGALYYERRRFYRWEQFEDDMRRWLARRAGGPAR